MKQKENQSRGYGNESNNTSARRRWIFGGKLRGIFTTNPFRDIYMKLNYRIHNNFK